jgi:hypothetical protein
MRGAKKNMRRPFVKLHSVQAGGRGGAVLAWRFNSDPRLSGFEFGICTWDCKYRLPSAAFINDAEEFETVVSVLESSAF